MRQMLLSRWPLMESQDHGEALRSINALMAPASVRGRDALSSASGRFSLNGFVDQDFAIGFFSSDLDLRANVSTEQEPSYFLVFGVFGELPLQLGKLRLLSTRSVATVVNPDERLAVLPERQPIGSLVIRLARRFVDQELTVLLGKDPGTDVRFDPVMDLAQPGPSGMRELLGRMLTQFDSEHELLTRPAMRRAVMRLLITSLLLAHQHTHAASLQQEAAPMRPRHLDRAIEYIESHLCEQITLGDVAQAAGRSSRTVDAGFRSCLGVPPMTHVRNLRLERVRAALQTSDETISTIALDAGFTHLGRFAAAYRARFGELPSKTRAGL
ncbi:AraC family transcriptional regulator [Streptomyces sp. NPDC097610]|uniref:helix-turn-helix transcriptional regulator n=1 Tax=Streptomyces sp. NPDC097610 TaxID=3157227 RepID=UPI0033275FA5